MPSNQEVVLPVGEFVAALNQTLEYAYQNVLLIGELANFRISKNRWLYFDLKDELATVKFFGTVYNLPGPLEDGMVLKVRGTPRLHPQYGFSVSVMTIQPAGEGTIRRAADLLQAKLAAEGLFEPARKRVLPYPPRRIGLITSKQSAAYADFMKILNARWRGLNLDFIDVQVQGDAAPDQIVAAIGTFNSLSQPPDVLVLIRGGGSPEDLAVFSNEQLTRAVAASRVPSLVAIGHEVDVSLAELAADQRASTPSNAAELLVPDKRQVLGQLREHRRQLDQSVASTLQAARTQLKQTTAQFTQLAVAIINQQHSRLQTGQQLLEALSPRAIVRRGYAIIRYNGTVLRDPTTLKTGSALAIELFNADLAATVNTIIPKKGS